MSKETPINIQNNPEEFDESNIYLQIKQYKINKRHGLSEPLPLVWKKDSRGELVSPSNINLTHRRNGAS